MNGITSSTSHYKVIVFKCWAVFWNNLFLKWGFISLLIAVLPRSGKLQLVALVLKSSSIFVKPYICKGPLTYSIRYYLQLETGSSAGTIGNIWIWDVSRPRTVTKSQASPTQSKQTRRTRISLVLWAVAACSRMVITWRHASHWKTNFVAGPNKYKYDCREGSGGTSREPCLEIELGQKEDVRRRWQRQRKVSQMSSSPALSIFG